MDGENSMNPGDTALCITSPALCAVKQGIGAAAGQAASDGFKKAAETMFAAYDDIFKQFMTSWVNSSFLVSLDNKATKWFQESNLPLAIFLLMIGLVVAGVRIMLAHRGEPFRDAMQALGKAVAVITLGSSAIQILTWGGDAYAQWILKASGTTAAAGVADAAFAASSPGLALIFGLIGVFAVGFQWVIMFVRQAMMLLLNAFWQLTASAALLRTGQQAFEKITAWIIAFILYMPVAASIYAFAWRLKNGQDGVGGVLYGMMLIALAVIALPAMMRLLLPASGAIGNAVGGAMALGVAAAALQAGVAVGAAVATGGASAGAGAGTAATTSTTTSTSVAEGGEAATGGGGGGGASSMTGGDDGASGAAGADGMVGGGADGASGASADGSTAGGSDVGGSTAGGSTADGAGGSGQSSGSKAAWAGAQSAAEGAGDEAKTAEGTFSE